MLKISTGLYKGKTLKAADDNTIRPTKNRTRMAMLNSIESRLHWDNMNIIDLCSGSGALGIECLSRGARHATFVDIKTNHTQDNLNSLMIPREMYSVIQADASTLNMGPFDVIFADPPYGNSLLEAFLKKSATLGQPGTLWALEEASTYTLHTPENMTLHKYKVFGKSAFWLLEQL